MTHQHQADKGPDAGLYCPECGSGKHEVQQGGSSKKYGGTYWRRRKCKDCGFLFHTYETYGYLMPSVNTANSY